MITFLKVILSWGCAGLLVQGVAHFFPARRRPGIRPGAARFAGFVLIGVGLLGLYFTYDVYTNMTVLITIAKVFISIACAGVLVSALTKLSPAHHNPDISSNIEFSVGIFGISMVVAILYFTWVVWE